MGYTLYKCIDFSELYLFSNISKIYVMKYEKSSRNKVKNYI